MKESMTNPLTVMMINMTIVFAVLYSLGWMIRLIHYIDPTRKKPEASAVVVPAPAPAAAIAPAAAAVVDDELEIAAVISAAIAAYGFKASQIVAIRPTGGKSWASAARVEVVSTRNQM